MSTHVFAVRDERQRRPEPRACRQTRRVLAVMRWPVGGIRSYILYNYPTLTEAGYRFTFVGPDDDTLANLGASVNHLDGAEFVGVPVRRKRCRLWPVVRRLLCGGRFDLIHSHGMTAAINVALGNLGLGVPHAVTMHEVLRDGQFAGLRGRVKRWLMGRLLGRADATIAVGEDPRTNLLRYFPRLGRGRRALVTIPNGIDTRRYADAAPAVEYSLRAQLGLEGNTALFGYLGRFMPEKGFPILLEALQQLTGRTDRTFHLAAFGSGDYRREYRAEAERRGLGDRVTLLDFVPDVRPVLLQLDLVVVPSLWETSPLVPMEALAAGVPVLASDCIGLREVLRDTPSVLVPTGDDAALSHGLQAALEEPWNAAAREYAAVAQDRFDNARSARRLVELFDRLAGA
jgi:glycosyltransferase involved in cell wall biosynthesis